MDVLSFPLKINNRGEFFKVSDTSDEYKAEQIKAFISTHVGERPLFPSFGVTDPTFDRFHPLEMIDAMGHFYGATLGITDIRVIKTQGAVDTIEVNFGR